MFLPSLQLCVCVCVVLFEMIDTCTHRREVEELDRGREGGREGERKGEGERERERERG